MSRIREMLKPIIKKCIDDINTQPTDDEWARLMIENACLKAIAAYQELLASELPEPGKNLGSAG